MPAKPLTTETLQLIDALRDALAQRADVQERGLFGSHCFFVDGKLCVGVKNGELLVRLPPTRHAEFQEMQNTRELSPGGGMQGYFWVEPNGFATRALWQMWLDEALAYNPQAKASPRRKAAGAAGAVANPKASKGPSKKKSAQAATLAVQADQAPAGARKRHSVFDAD